jgi:hypothetical protein
VVVNRRRFKHVTPPPVFAPSRDSVSGAAVTLVHRVLVPALLTLPTPNRNG